MDALQLQDALRDMLDWLLEEKDDPDDPLADLIEPVAGIGEIRTFEEADILTTDRGLVIECDDGTEYQVSIVRSR